MIKDTFKLLFKAEFAELESLKAKNALETQKANLAAAADKSKAEEVLTAQFKTELENRITQVLADQKSELDKVKAEYESKISNMATEHLNALEAEKKSVIAQTNKNLAGIGGSQTAVPEEIKLAVGTGKSVSIIRY